MNRAASAVAAALLCSLAAGCSTLEMKAGDTDKWAARRAPLLAIERFTLQARVSSGGIFGVKGTLNWRQDGGDSDLRVAGPFGVGATSITRRGETVTIKSAKGEFTTDDVEGDLQKRLGWSFPVAHLRYWVLGAPAPGSRAEYELDKAGRITALGQDGWELVYEEYMKSGKVELPRKFTVSNTRVKIKVVVDSWSLD